MENINEVNELISFGIILLLYLFTYLLTINKLKFDKRVLVLLYISIMIRVIFSILNLYYFKNFLPHSGGDSITFETFGYYLATGVLDINTYSWDNYPKFIFLIYSIIGRKPLVIIGINGVLSILSALLLYKIIYAVSKDENKSFFGMAVFLLFPHNIIFSSIILRESMITFFLTSSLYWFIKYKQNKKTIRIMLSFIFLLISSYMHAGVIFFSIGYLYYIFKDKNIVGKLVLFRKPVTIILVIAMLVGAFSFGGGMFRKLRVFNSIDTFVYRIGNVIGNTGSSAYLQGFYINSLQDVVVFTPFKLIYFFFSPMPWDIRNINDIIAFLLDSVFYLYFLKKLFVKTIRTRWKDSRNLLYRSIIAGTISMAIVFSLGTANAGTALRHRYKLLPVILFAMHIPTREKTRRTRTSFNKLFLKENQTDIARSEHHYGL